MNVGSWNRWLISSGWFALRVGKESVQFSDGNWRILMLDKESTTCLRSLASYRQLTLGRQRTECYELKLITSFFLVFTTKAMSA